jgi:sodium transport system permease protein
MITVEEIAKAFGKRREIAAVAGVSFTAADGEITGLLGPNGAGKTTLLRILATLMCPDAGTATVDGRDVVRDRYEVRRNIGVLSDARGLYPRLTGRENIRYYGTLHGASGALLDARVDSLVHALGVEDIADRRAQGYSQGERMKVAIARALVHDPHTLLLDEPTNGLDIMSTRALRTLPRLLVSCDAGSDGAVRSHRHPRPRPRGCGGHGARTRRALGGGNARGCVRGAAWLRRGTCRMSALIHSAGSGATRVAAVARKEMVDMARDRRTALLTLMPAIAGPLFLVLILELLSSQADRSHELTLPVAGRDNAPALVAFLARQQVKTVPAPQDYEARVRAGDLDVVLDIDPKFAADVANGKPGTVRLVFDRSRDRARAAIDRTEAVLRAFNREWGRARLLLRGVSPDVANPLSVEPQDVATPQSSGSVVLFLVAYYALFAALLGGMAMALDATAGERERASLEPLLATPARPLELALGKWFAVMAFDGIVVGLTLTVFYLTLRFAPLPAIGIPFLFGIRELLRFIVVLLPLIALVGATLLYVGARGRTQKEAQANVSLILTVVAVVPLLPMFLQRKDPAWLALVPVSGQYSLLSRALRGEALPAVDLAMAWGVCLVLAALALLLFARLLSRESVLAGK